MMQNETARQFKKLVKALYLSPTSPDGFQCFVDFLNYEFRTISFVLSTIHKQESTIISSWKSGSRAENLLSVIQHIVKDKACVRDKFSQLPSNRFFSLVDKYQAFSTQKKSLYLNPITDWYDKTVTNNIATIIFGYVGDLAITLSFYAENEEGINNSTSRILLAELIPHIQQSFKLYIRISERYNYTNIYKSIIDKSSHAIILCDKVGNTICSNSKAIQLSQWHDLVTIKDYHFQINDNQFYKEYCALYKRIARLDNETDLNCHAFEINDRSSTVTLILVPINRGKADKDLNHEEKSTTASLVPKTIVYIYDRRHPVTINTNCLKSIFDLTEMERNICCLILRGLSRKEIASVLERSEYTIKDHIKSIFVKTDSNTQSELLLTLLNCPIH
jgi:DNA-binding CsgD family transcriptional regulator